MSVSNEESKRRIWSLNLNGLRWWVSFFISLGAVCGLALGVAIWAGDNFFEHQLEASPFVDLTDPANATEATIPAVGILIDAKIKEHEARTELLANIERSKLNEKLAILDERLKATDARIVRIEHMIEIMFKERENG